jgi:hypothetical protein
MFCVGDLAFLLTETLQHTNSVITQPALIPLNNTNLPILLFHANRQVDQTKKELSH